MRWIVLISLFLAVPAHAEPAEEDVRKAIFRLTTAYQCASIMDDYGPYKWAKEDAAQIVGDDKTADMIAYVEAQSREGSPLTERMCRNLTKNYK